MGRYKTYKDYLNDVYAQFPELSMSELEMIIKYGCNRLSRCIKSGCDVYLNLRLTDDYKFETLIGKSLFINKKEKHKYVLKKYLNKLYYFYNKNKEVNNYNGYYYFGLTNTAFQRLLDNNTNTKKFNTKKGIVSKFRDQRIMIDCVVLHRNLDECKCNLNYRHIFRVAIGTMQDYNIYYENINLTGAEYYLKRTLDGFKNPYDNKIIDYNIKFKNKYNL